MNIMINDTNAFEYIAWLNTELNYWYKRYEGDDNAYCNITHFSLMPRLDDEDDSNFVCVKGNYGFIDGDNHSFTIAINMEELNVSFIKGYIICTMERE